MDISYYPRLGLCQTPGRSLRAQYHENGIKSVCVGVEEKEAEKDCRVVTRESYWDSTRGATEAELRCRKRGPHQKRAFERSSLPGRIGGRR